MVRSFLEESRRRKTKRMRKDRRNVSCALECSWVMRVIKHFSIEAEIRLRGATPFVNRLFALCVGLRRLWLAPSTVLGVPCGHAFHIFAVLTFDDHFRPRQ
jgi:hypothetical protein